VQKLCFIILFTIALACPALAQYQTVAINAQATCGNAYENGVAVNLGAGIHYLTLTGAFSNWNVNTENGGNAWITLARARVSATGDTYNYSAGTGWKASPTAAAAEVAGMVFELTLATAGQVVFATIDNPCGDNRGTVYVTIDDPVGVESRSWGTLKAMHR